jgi:hypothetical protein
MSEKSKPKGMETKEIFGEELYTESAADMIKKGEMVTPYIHFVNGKSGEIVDFSKLDNDYEAIFKSVESSFFAHENRIKEISYNPDEIGAKILVVCRGQTDLQQMYKTKAWSNFRKEYPDNHLFALSSEFGILIDDDDSYVSIPEEGKLSTVTNAKKFELIKKIKGLKNNDRCIIFHVDMIGEGIDIPAITGVMPFRNLQLSKFIQNVGRASRLHKIDRANFYSDKITVADQGSWVENSKIKVGEKGKWIKPCSWIIIPEFLAASTGFDHRFQEITQKLRKDFGYIPEEHILIDNIKGTEEDDAPPVNNWKNDNKKHENSGQTTYDHIFEDLRSAAEKIAYDEDVEDGSNKALEELRNIIKNA